MRIKSLLFIVLIILFFAGYSSIVGAQNITLKLGSTNAPETLYSKSINYLAELVDKKSEGRLQIEYYPASQLGSALDQAEGVMYGEIDMFMSRVEWYSQFVQDWNILALSFGFESEDDFNRFFETDIHKELKKELLNEYGVRMISDNLRNEPRIMVATRPVFNEKDISLLTIRVPEIEVYNKVWELLAHPTQIAFGETYLALQQGVVDAMESPIGIIYGSSLYEPAPYVLVTNHMYGRSSLIINEEKYQSLPEDLQNVLKESIRETEERHNQLSIMEDQKVLEKFVENGAVLIYFNTLPLKEKILNNIGNFESAGLWSEGLYQKVQELVRVQQ